VHPIARALLVPLLLSTTSCALVTLSTVKKSFPDHDGTFVVPGLEAPATLVRDDLGVPHVKAANEMDAWYGLGFAHGQDRLFQADLTRRVGAGEVAVWFGERAVHFDRFMKAMDLRARGRAAYAASDAETKAVFDSYAAGLNAAAALQLPVEYRLLGAEWTPWTPEDSAIIGFMQAWSLAGNLKQELVALQLGDADPALVDAMMRSNPDTPPFDPFWEELRATGPFTYTKGFEAFTSQLGGRVGNMEASNAWIVDGSRTASGAAMIVNDPHLGQRVPSLWYLADIEGGDMHVAGATLAGFPSFPVGHNASMAWGLTNLMADVTDTVILERVGDDAVRIAGEVVPLEMREISVPLDKGDPDVGTVVTTPIGPVISELEGDHVLVMRWQVPELDDHVIQITRALATTPTVAEVLPKLRGNTMGPTMNLNIADTTGDWAWQVIGSVPKRKNHTGRVPYPGSDPAHGWDGWLEDLPYLHAAEMGAADPVEMDTEDGAEGMDADAARDDVVEEPPAPRPFYVSANHPPDHPLKDAISTTYSPMLRHDRIAELLSDATDITPEQMHRMQMDLREAGAARYRDRLLAKAEPTTDAGRRAKEVLAAWDLEATVESEGTTVWAALLRALVQEQLDGALDPAQQHLLLGVISAGRHPINGDPDRFVDDRVGAALDRAGADLLGRFGDDWTWGPKHPLALKHPFGAQSKLLEGWNMPVVPFPGTSDTVAASSFSFVTDDFEVTQLPSVRLVMPLDDLAASTVVHPGGQTGHPKHPLYRSHWDLFVAEETRPLGFGLPAAGKRVELTPR
jgi:penicillin amidase